MVMTRSNGFGSKRLVKGNSSSKGKTFVQEGLVIDPIDMEPLSSMPPGALVPYRTFENEIPTTEGSK